MSKRNLAIGGGLVALVALALFLLLRGEQTPETEGEPEGPDAAEQRRELIERKRAARDELGIERLAPRVVTGLVARESDGKGVPGAVVLLTRKAITQGGSAQPGQPPAPLHAVTDDAGEFSLESVPPGRYVISATAAGYLPGQRNDVHILGGRQDQRVTLTLAAGGHRLSGTVSDIGGGPIEEVLVSVNDMESGNLFGVRFAPPATLTDEEGHYELYLPNGSYVLNTFHPDYVGAVRITQIMDGPRTEDLELVPGASIEGVVVARGSGKPIGDAIVTFMDGRNGNTGAFRINISADGRMVRTDAKGRFHLQGVQPGVAQVEARATGFGSREAVAVPVGIGETVTGIELELDEAFTVSGFVVPKDDLEGAVEGVMVGAYSLSPPSLTVAVAPTDADGYFEILGMPPGNYTVGALGEEMLPNISGAAVVLRDADVTDVLVKMDVGHRIRGRVEPAALAKVSLSIDMGEMSLGKILDAVSVAFARTTADATGAFDLGPVADGKYTLIADAPDGSHAELEVEVAGSDLEGLVLPLESRASVSGVVVDATGAPQPGLTVRFQAVDGQSMDLGKMMRGPFGDGGVPTGDDGSYVARGLEAGRYSVIVRDQKARAIPWADDGEATEPSPLVVEVVEGVDRSGLELRVQARSGVLAGTVVDASGGPVADAWVTASLQITGEQLGAMMTGPKVPKPGERERRRGVLPPDDEGDDFELPGFFAEKPVLTDELGRFTVTGLRPGQRYTIVAEGDKGGARGRLEDLRPDEEGLVIALEAVAGITGVVTAEGKPVEQYTVKLEGPSRRSKSVFAKDGRFSIERIDPGEYRVAITAELGVARKEEVTVEAEQLTELALALEDYGTIEGKLVDVATGEPIAGMMALVQPDTGDVDPSQAMAMLMGGGTKTGGDGRFEAKKVAPGKGLVVFLDTAAALSGGGGTVAAKGYEIDAGQTLDLGTINGVLTERVDPAERGTYGLGVTVTTRAKRPRPPGTKLEDEGEEADPDATPRLWVSYVEIGGPADEEGVQPGDEVVAVDGQPVAMLSPHAAEVRIEGQVKVGEQISLDLEREGSGRSVTIEAEPKEAKKEGGEGGP
ncbi:MAG: carboxypeptidase regulatory-like domain-containing protein [Myxococcales bacterium]|nr:carboxypeptidase regulatory-like domain-containing protein [Myxococcales bacterium]